MCKLILQDLNYKRQCYNLPDKFLSYLKILLSDGSLAMTIYRAACFLQSYKLGLLAWPLTVLNKFLNGCVISSKASFGRGFVIMHPVGVVINGAVMGGNNIIIQSGVVIGVKNNTLPVKAPTLGDNINIGSGAKIFGDIKIGNDVTIGANAVVINDVADGMTVVGIPAKPLSRTAGESCEK